MAGKNEVETMLKTENMAEAEEVYDFVKTLPEDKKVEISYLLKGVKIGIGLSNKPNFSWNNELGRSD